MYNTAQCIGKSSEEFVLLAQPACTVYALGPLQPEHKIPKIRYQTPKISRVLNCIKVLCRNHICSS